MRQTIKISASLLAADFGNLGKAVRDAEHAHVDSIHIDFMDGHYVHNLSFGIDVIAALRPYTCLPLMAHLEISDPDDFISDFAQAGADMIVVCEDTCPDPEATIRTIRSKGVQVGVSLNPDRPLDLAMGYLNQLDLLLILTVLPGFGGQELMRSVLPKIGVARSLINGLGKPVTLGVDGGISRETVADIVGAGADTLIVGSAIYRGDVGENVRALRSRITTMRGPDAS